MIDGNAGAQLPHARNTPLVTERLDGCQSESLNACRPLKVRRVDSHGRRHHEWQELQKGKCCVPGEGGNRKAGAFSTESVAVLLQAMIKFASDAFEENIK